jgi:hypothetical protein
VRENLAVCRDCGEVFGRLAPPGSTRLVDQRCGCGSGSGPSEMWVVHKRIYNLFLCRCCGQELLEAISKLSIWFCPGCKQEIGLLNGRLGRCVLPLGPHSLHGGFALTGSSTDLDIEIYAANWGHISDALEKILAWSSLVVRSIIQEEWPRGSDPIPLIDYLKCCRPEAEEKMHRFRGMIEFLQG